MPRAAWSASARGGSRKKIGYNEEHTERENCLKPFGSQQFSCTYRCASGRSGPPPTPPAIAFRSRGLCPLDPRRCRRESVGSLTPINCNLPPPPNSAKHCSLIFPHNSAIIGNVRAVSLDLPSSFLRSRKWGFPRFRHETHSQAVPIRRHDRDMP